LQFGDASVPSRPVTGLRIAKIILPLALLISAEAEAKSDSQVWTTLNATAKLGGKWRLSEEVVARFSDNRNGLYEIESNTLLGYVVAKDVTLWAGYTHDPQYSAGDFTIMEHRAREQATFDNFANVGQAKFSARLRTEQRWREGVDGTGWRVRPYLKFSLPLKDKIALNLTNEPFFNLNRTTFQKQTGLDRTRSLVSVSLPLTKSLSGEVGYMNQHGFVRGGPDTDDHIAYFAISARLN
jgi:hypothetical protein